MIPGSGRSAGEGIVYRLQCSWASLVIQLVKTACHAGDLGSIPGLKRSHGEGNGYPLQYSGLENSMDCLVHGVTKSWTQLSNFHFHFQVCHSFPSKEQVSFNFMAIVTVHSDSIAPFSPTPLLLPQSRAPSFSLPWTIAMTS